MSDAMREILEHLTAATVHLSSAVTLSLTTLAGSGDEDDPPSERRATPEQVADVIGALAIARTDIFELIRASRYLLAYGPGETFTMRHLDGRDPHAAVMVTRERLAMAADFIGQAQAPLASAMEHAAAVICIPLDDPPTAQRKENT